MKKLWIILAAVVAGLLSGCAISDNIPPDEVTIEERHYRTGFYGYLYPGDFSFTGKEYEVGSHTYRQVDTERFDWVLLNRGVKEGKTIYCEESWWDEAKAFYEDNGNFTFYCKIGAPKYGMEPVTRIIEDMDFEKFEALEQFSEKNEYTPFSPKEIKNEQVVEMPAEWDSPRISIYKVSNDGYFSSLQYQYYIIDEKMYLVRYYLYKEGKMHVMEIPEETADYFILAVEKLIPMRKNRFA